MQVVHPEFLPNPSLSRDEMVQLQHEIAAHAVFADRYDRAIDGELVVAGVDQAFREDRAVSGVVVMQGDEVMDRVSATVDLRIPYIPGLLAFREGEAIAAALQKLDHAPDVVLFDGSGRIHYRQAGIATHMGVVFDVPSVGVAKSLLCGEPEQRIDTPLPMGACIPVHADETVDAAAGAVIGYAYQSKQFELVDRRHINPLYISPGHRVTAETSVELVERCCTTRKLPDPVHLADRFVAEKTNRSS